MAKALPIEIRKEIIRLYTNSHKMTDIADKFGCHLSTVNRIIKQYLMDGTIGVKKRGGNVEPKLENIHIAMIQRYIEENNLIRLEDLRRLLIIELETFVSNATIHRTTSNFNFAMIRNTDGPIEETEPLNQSLESIPSYIKGLSEEDQGKVYFLDRAQYTLSMMHGRDRETVQSSQLMREMVVITIVVMVSKFGVFQFEIQENFYGTESLGNFVRGALESLDNFGIKNAEIFINRNSFSDSEDINKLAENLECTFKNIPLNSENFNLAERFFELWSAKVRKYKPVDGQDLFKKLTEEVYNIETKFLSKCFEELISIKEVKKRQKKKK